MTVPAPVIVTVLPAMVAGPETMLKVTARPDDEVALTGNAGSPKRLAGQRAEGNRLASRRHDERLIDINRGSIRGAADAAAGRRGPHGDGASARDRHHVAGDRGRTRRDGEAHRQAGRRRRVDGERRVTKRLPAQREESNRLVRRRRRFGWQRGAADDRRRRAPESDSGPRSPAAPRYWMYRDCRPSGPGTTGTNGLQVPSGVGVLPVRTPIASVVLAGVSAVQLILCQLTATPASNTRETNDPALAYGDSPDPVDDDGAAEGVEVAGGDRPHRRRNRHRCGSPPAHRRLE